MKKRVVIVEDDKQLREELRREIDRSEGYECVDQIGRAELALKIIPTLEPDLVLMDIELPGMDGIACTAQLKRDYPKLHVLVLTSFEDSDRVFNALKAGVSGYLVKWDTVGNLIERMDEVFQGGSPMTSHIARKVVQYFHRFEPEPTDDKKQLSPREMEILELIAGGFIYKEIAAKLDIGFETVRTYVKNIYEKLHIRSRAEAVVYFTKHPKE
jgi:DNA-binding NarL/FixJ family response regulator